MKKNCLQNFDDLLSVAKNDTLNIFWIFAKCYEDEEKAEKCSYHVAKKLEELNKYKYTLDKPIVSFKPTHLRYNFNII